MPYPNYGGDDAGMRRRGRPRGRGGEQRAPFRGVGRMMQQGQATPRRRGAYGGDMPLAGRGGPVRRGRRDRTAGGQPIEGNMAPREPIGQVTPFTPGQAGPMPARPINPAFQPGGRQIEGNMAPREPIGAVPDFDPRQTGPTPVGPGGQTGPTPMAGPIEPILPTTAPMAPAGPVRQEFDMGGFTPSFDEIMPARELTPEEQARLGARWAI